MSTMLQAFMFVAIKIYQQKVMKSVENTQRFHVFAFSELVWGRDEHRASRERLPAARRNDF